MCRLIALAVLLLVVLLVLAIVLAAKYLPWWGTVLVIVGVIVILPLALKVAGRWMFTGVLKSLFGAKGKVLRGATATVHSVQSAAAPRRRRATIDGSASDDRPRTPNTLLVVDGNALGGSKPEDAEDDEVDDEDRQEEGDEADHTPRDHYYVDVTVTPKPSTGKFTHWDIDDLMLVPYDMKVTPASDVDDDACKVREVRLMREGAAAEPDGSKFAGPQRLRLLIAVRPDVQRLKFRYYFEVFGDVRVGKESDRAKKR